MLDFFSTTSCGDTDATRMLKATFDLLQSKKEYMNADVLWITDFKIPLPSPKLTDRILEYRKADTHFYGLQLGIAENEWIPFLRSSLQSRLSGCPLLLIFALNTGCIF